VFYDLATHLAKGSGSVTLNFYFLFLYLCGSIFQSLGDKKLRAIYFVKKKKKKIINGLVCHNLLAYRNILSLFKL
jgi:hypothetical protein